MQNYKEIAETDLVRDSRAIINENTQTLLSNNSGTAFPTEKLVEGMKCYRTDLKKTYTLVDATNGTWQADGTGDGGISAWESGKEYKKNSLVCFGTDVYLVLNDYTAGATPTVDVTAGNLASVSAGNVSTSNTDAFMTSAEVDALFS